MVLFLLFSIGLNEIMKPIEKEIFKGYRGTVMVTYEQGGGEMQIIKSGKEILIQYVIPTEQLENMPLDYFSLDIPPINEEVVQMNRKDKSARRTTIEIPVIYSNGETFIGGDISKLLSYIFIGYRSSLLHLIDEYREEDFRLIGEKYGYRIEFERGSCLPMYIKTPGKEIIFDGWRKVEGLGYLPENVEVWIGGKKAGERKLKSVTNPMLETSFFSVKKNKIPIVME
ncbi:MAG: hypothetical protein ABIN61_00610 [candidate division WOR-3 bacterium]